MPELPDVEGFRRYFNRFAAGQRVQRLEVLDPVMLRNSTPRAAGRALRGRRLGRASRHGKWLRVGADGPELLMHFGMTGLLRWSGENAETARHRHDRVVLHVEGGELAYRNMRKLGGTWIARDAAEAERILGPLGPDAASISAEDFTELVQRRRGGIKALLMDQRALAGVGNLLADEALWRARIHPRRPAGRLSRAKVTALYEQLQFTIREANRHGRIPPIAGWLTGVRDQRGDCPRCGTRVRKATVAGRTACWCPRCQR